MQDALFRLEDRFNERLREAMFPLENSTDARVRQRAIARRLLYSSIALDIATGSDPESSLLDMFVFLELSLRRLFAGTGSLNSEWRGSQSWRHLTRLPRTFTSGLPAY